MNEIKQLIEAYKGKLDRMKKNRPNLNRDARDYADGEIDTLRQVISDLQKSIPDKRRDDRSDDERLKNYYSHG